MKYELKTPEDVTEGNFPHDENELLEWFLERLKSLKEMDQKALIGFSKALYQVEYGCELDLDKGEVKLNEMPIDV